MDDTKDLMLFVSSPHFITVVKPASDDVEHSPHHRVLKAGNFLA